jgi:tetratricopeptide (TPR) repeat protein
MQSIMESRNTFVAWDREHWHDWTEFLVNYREMHLILEGAPPKEDALQLVVRGRALAALGRMDAAELAYTRALRLAPNDPKIREACANLNATRAPAK